MEDIKIHVREQAGRVWTGFIWLRIDTGGGLPRSVYAFLISPSLIKEPG
jgi:hypothetical protein